MSEKGSPNPFLAAVARAPEMAAALDCFEGFTDGLVATTPEAQEQLDRTRAAVGKARQKIRDVVGL